jgi:tRNA(Ile)-lysidine synthase
MTLLEILQRSELLPPGERVLVGCSGGGDSLALAHALSLVRPGQVEAAVVDHGVREGSLDEARAVAALLDSWHIPSAVLSPVPETEGSPEDRLRRQRLGALAAHARARGIGRVVLAHHARDQLETILMRLMRGTGLEGLGGMKALRPLDTTCLLVRPVLSCPPEWLVAHARAHGLTPWEDPTNRDRRIPRNRIRLDALPALTSLNPAWPANLTSMVSRWQDEEAFLQARATEALERLHPRHLEGLVAWRQEAFEQVAPVLQRRIMRLATREVGGLPHDLDSATIERLRTDTSPLADVGQGLRVERRHGWFILAHGKGPSPNDPRLRRCDPDTDLFRPPGRTRMRTLRYHLARRRIPWLVQERLWVLARDGCVLAVMGGPLADEETPDLATIERPKSGWPGETWFDKGGGPP